MKFSSKAYKYISEKTYFKTKQSKTKNRRRFIQKGKK